MLSQATVQKLNYNDQQLLFIIHTLCIEFIPSRVNERASIELMRRFPESVAVCSEHVVIFPEEGSTQGSIISPGCANIYLHYILAYRFEKEFKRKMGVVAQH